MKVTLKEFSLLQAGSGPLVGICRYDGSIVTAAQSGAVTVWRCGDNTRLDAVQTEVSNMGQLRCGTCSFEYNIVPKIV